MPAGNHNKFQETSTATHRFVQFFPFSCFRISVQNKKKKNTQPFHVFTHFVSTGGKKGLRKEKINNNRQVTD